MQSAKGCLTANGVLILHHSTSGGAAAEKFEYRQSSFSVMDEVQEVTAALERLGIEYRVESIKQIADLPETLRQSPEKIIVNLVEELENGVSDYCYVPAVCRSYGKACTGGDTRCLLLAQDKWRTKAVLKAAGVAVPDGLVVPVGKEICLTELRPGRYIVKPALADASEGIDSTSVVDLPGTSLTKAVKRVHEQMEQPALIERFIPSRELNVSLLQHQNKIEALPIAEIDFSTFERDCPRIVDYSAKWLSDSFAYNNTPSIIPASLPNRLERLIRTYALRAWHALDCLDFARVDFRVDENDNVFILEFNPNPDISPEGGFTASLAAAKISFDEFIRILLYNASARLSRSYSKTPRHFRTNGKRESTEDKYSLHIS